MKLNQINKVAGFCRLSEFLHMGAIFMCEEEAKVTQDGKKPQIFPVNLVHVFIFPAGLI